MAKGDIIRQRPRSEMVAVFWGDRENHSWLLMHLLLEKTTCIDEDDTGSRWYEVICRALRELKIKDYARVRRSLRELAKIENVSLDSIE